MHALIQKTKFKFGHIDLFKELARKFIHISACLFALFILKEDIKLLEFTLLPAVIVASLLAEKVEIFNKNISFGKNRRWGGIYLAAGLTIILFSLADYEVKKFAILTLGIADAFAAIIGKTIPIIKLKVFDGYKSVGGTLTFILGILLAAQLSFSTELEWGRVLVAALLLAAIEFFNFRSLDNLSLPISALILATIFLI